MTGHNLRIPVGDEHVLVLHRRYEMLSILNDIMVALWFLIGSLLFFSESTQTAGTVLFVLGSVELLIRPVIRLVRNAHMRRAGGPQTSRTGDF